MHDIEQSALDAAAAIMRGPKHINPVQEKARIQCIIIDAMKQLNTRHTPEGWLMLHAAAVNALSEMPVAGESDKQDEARMELIDALAAAPKWGVE